MAIVEAYQTTAYKIDWETLASKVEKLVMDKLASDLESWPDDRGMRAMFLGDASDGVEVAELLALGSWPAVDTRLWQMDTAARDHVYDFIEQVAGPEFFAIVRSK